MTAPLLQLQNLSKNFYGVPVLKEVSLEIDPGRIVGLVGENGAGKSTLMNLIGGVLASDAGSMTCQGQEYAPPHPAAARRLGVSLVHQELNLFPNLTVAENLFLTDFPHWGWGRFAWIRSRETDRQAREALSRLGLSISPRMRLDRLSAGERQLIEIAKGLQGDPRLILLDEPTTSLSEPQAERLFEILNELRSRGTSIIYISHNLNHVLNLCDDIVVLRDGQTQAIGPRSEFDLDRMISLMVGRKIESIFPDRAALPQPQPLMQVEGITQPGVVRDVSFTLHRGEILGLSGLMGAGRTELARILFGLDPCAAGRILLDGKPFQPSPRKSIEGGLAFITESRRDDGLLIDSSVTDNAVLASLRRWSVPGLGAFRRRAALNDVRETTSRLNLKSRSLEQQPVLTLSGGNQQKVVLAKWLLARPRVLMIDEPTRGVDVGAKTEIYEFLNQLSAQGTGILVIASELEELVGLCDRILVMAAGEIRKELTRQEFHRETILRHAFGEERLA